MENRTGLKCQELHQLSDEVEVNLDDGKDSLKIGRMALFASSSLPEEQGGIAFVGGPVSALEFHPSAKGICALSAHRQDQRNHEMLQCYEGEGHIQLWDFSLQKPTCIGLVPHKGDCAWDLKWKPQRETAGNGSSGWNGTLAASLGDGTVMVTELKSATNPSASPLNCELQTLSTVILRREGATTDRTPVRVMQWSQDGGLLLVGSADGSLEVHCAQPSDKHWPKWSFPAHESVITDMRWISETLLCSLGLSCVLRLRDIRDPTSTLEQNAEALSGSYSMDALEPNVAVVGTDSGYLRVVRLSGSDGISVKLPVKRVHLQTGAFRDMQSVILNGLTEGQKKTVLYTGGAEGILHEVIFPRPIWKSRQQSNIAKTQILQKLRWTVKKAVQGEDPMAPRAETLHLQLGKDVPKNDINMKLPSQVKPSTPTNQTEKTQNGPVPADVETQVQSAKDDTAIPEEERKTPTSKKTPVRKSKAIGKPTSELKDQACFGEHYNQKVMVSCISISEKSDLLAIGIDGGFVTWVPLGLEKNRILVKQQAERARERAALSAQINLLKPPRKRGRPRKYPFVDPIIPGTPSSAAVVPLNGSAVDRAPAAACGEQKTPVHTVAAPGALNKTEDTSEITPADGKKPEESDEVKPKRPRGRPRLGPPIFGPKRKRGRPRKIPDRSAEASPKPTIAKKRGRKPKNSLSGAETQTTVTDADLHTEGKTNEAAKPRVVEIRLQQNGAQAAPATADDDGHAEGEVNDVTKPKVVEILEGWRGAQAPPPDARTDQEPEGTATAKQDEESLADKATQAEQEPDGTGSTLHNEDMHHDKVAEGSVAYVNETTDVTYGDGAKPVKQLSEAHPSEMAAVSSAGPPEPVMKHLPTRGECKEEANYMTVGEAGTAQGAEPHGTGTAHDEEMHIDMVAGDNAANDKTADATYEDGTGDAKRLPETLPSAAAASRTESSELGLEHVPTRGEVDDEADAVKIGEAGTADQASMKEASPARRGGKAAMTAAAVTRPPPRRSTRKRARAEAEAQQQKEQAQQGLWLPNSPVKTREKYYMRVRVRRARLEDKVFLTMRVRETLERGGKRTRIGPVGEGATAAQGVRAGAAAGVDTGVELRLRLRAAEDGPLAAAGGAEGAAGGSGRARGDGAGREEADGDRLIRSAGESSEGDAQSAAEGAGGRLRKRARRPTWKVLEG